MSSTSDPTSSGEETSAAQPTTREIPVVPAGGATPAPAPAQTPGAPPLPPHPGTLPPAPVTPPEQPVAQAHQAPAPDGPQQTGPVDFVPGLPGAGTSPPPPPPVQPVPTGGSTAMAGPDGRSWPDTLEAEAPAKAPGLRAPRLRPPRLRAPQDRAALLGAGLAVLALVLLELGLALGFGGRSFWSLVPLWSGFATLAALLALVGVVPTGRTTQPGNAAPRAAAAGLRWRIAAGGLVGVAVFWLLVVLPHADTNRGFVLTAALGALGAALWIGPARSR